MNDKFICSCCGNLCESLKHKIQDDDSWICSECLQKAAAALEMTIVDVSISKIQEALEQNEFAEIQNAFIASEIPFPEEYMDSTLYSPFFESGTSSTDCDSPQKTLSFKVAGVTFKTGRKSRQVMLKNMYFNNTPPFDGEINISFKRYEFEGKLAIGVYANCEQIGNVPASLTQTFDAYWSSGYAATYNIYGGYDNKPWGCLIDVEFD